MRTDEDDPRDTEEETSEEIQQEDPIMNDVSALTEDELVRYGTFRRTGFNKPGIRKFVSQVLGQTCNPNFAIVLSGIAKVFVSELVEEAKKVQSEWEEPGELMPSQIHEAYRRLYHRMPNMGAPLRR
ncbi:transcription initiation factor TFIID subunit 11 [Nematocida homosporus]|uniref:transcription initiation factor TFIID subunit 11 n=1 Tax=Nematocida homosporus TaxID=1912981 RepID=UPI00221FA69B|nr:transcription initiation factor TFIID subunit 11 [Nematocida homosporus]KAI5184305.1 transcription initiation factor TFIID subunit 11 [Nematocida homosporus]